MTPRLKRTLFLVPILAAGAGATAALAQQLGGTYDIAQMPALHGKVAQYDLTPRGDVDGLILQDGTEVHFPPHLGTQMVAAVRPGEAVTIHGLKARVLPLVQAMSVTGDASGKTVVDNGPPGPGHRPPPPHGPHPGPGGRPHGWGQAMQAQGTIKMQLHGPRGELNGALLADGTMVHFPPPEASRLAASLQPGKVIAVRGHGVDNTLGHSIAADAVGPSLDNLAPFGRELADGGHVPGPPR
ncbi:hypothetical protein [Lichenicoccus sp.]|uniref:hypothetical protein n=1 Tax=Lichenicoccus sp. TaxID=2781899 RepID=UPI003D136B18